MTESVSDVNVKRSNYLGRRSMFIFQMQKCVIHTYSLQCESNLNLLLLLKSIDLIDFARIFKKTVVDAAYGMRK